MTPSPTRDDLLALPAVVDLPTAARAWQIGRNRAYELAARGELPFPVVRLGNSYRVVTEHLLASLGLATQTSSAATPPSMRTTGVPTPAAATTDTHGSNRELAQQRNRPLAS